MHVFILMEASLAIYIRYVRSEQMKIFGKIQFLNCNLPSCDYDTPFILLPSFKLSKLFDSLLCEGQ